MGAFSVYKVYSGNLIQETFKSSAAKQVVEKQAGPADLVIKDIYYNKVDSIIISYCNESTNATVKGIAMKIEANKIISNNPGSYYPLLQAGECDTARAFLNYFKLKPGGSAKITATLDPNNVIIETNKENNTMTKDVNF